MEKPISILGAGNGGHQMAIDLTLRGFDVILCEHPSFEESFKSSFLKEILACVEHINGVTYDNIMKMPTYERRFFINTIIERNNQKSEDNNNSVTSTGKGERVRKISGEGVKKYSGKI